MIVFTLVAAFVLIPIVGLGIDVSIQYWIKAKLSSAVDAAALAAGRSLNVGSTIATQTANAQAVGRQYFAANFPTGGSSGHAFGGVQVINGAQVANSVSISVNSTSSMITVSASAQVTAPLYFMRVLGVSAGTITATSQSTRRNANVLLVLDRSGSMNNASNSCGALVSAVEFFTNQFVDGRDQIGLVTFSTSANVDYATTTSFKTGSPAINSVIDSMACVGATSTAQGLTSAYNEILRVNQPSALNVILFFTDGAANSLVATYPIKTQPDYRYDYVNTSQLTSYPASPCSNSAVLKGGYTDYSRSTNPTGSTGGVFSVVAAPISGGSGYPSVISTASNCTFTKSGAYGSYNVYNGRSDVAYIPDKDSFGNSTRGYKTVDVYPSGLGPYTGKIRADSPAGIRYAAINAADYVAQKIHSDATYGIVTYAIGLSGNEPIPMDTDFMRRIANAPQASNYNPDQPQGMFMLANDNASLSDAFNAVASQILRLSK